MTYRFTISKNGGLFTDINPIYTDSHTRSWTRDGDNAFLRAQISQAFIFTLGRGYNLINEADYEDGFVMKIEQQASIGWVEYFVGQFSKADCSIDQDTKRIEAKLLPLDKYTEVLKGWSEEQDILKMGLRERSFVFEDGALVQMFFSFQKRAYSITNGQAYLSDFGVDFSFDSVTNLSEPNYIVYIPGSQNDLVTHDIFGAYDVILAGTNGVNAYIQQGGDGAVFGQSGFFGGDFGMTINNVPLYQQTNPPVGASEPDQGGRNFIYFASYDELQVNPDAPILFAAFVCRHYGRILLRNSTFNGQPANPIPEEDTLAQLTDYTHILPFQLDGVLASDLATDAFTPYGRFGPNAIFNADQYFVKPAGASFNVPLIGMGELSLWFTWPQAQLDLFNTQNEDREIRDAYLFSEAINGLVIGASSGNASYGGSELLDSLVNPITGEDGVTLLIVPKSNVLTRGYTLPANKGPLKLSEVQELLFAFRNAKWRMDANLLKWEHVSWYENGGTYSIDGNVSVDIQQSTESRTRLKWEYKSSKFTYRKGEVPQRIQLKAMDSESPSFSDSFLKIESNYANADQADERITSLFSFDLDYANRYPNGYTETGFFLVAVRLDGDKFRVVSGQIGTYGIAQNHVFAKPYVLENYYRHASPARKMSIDGVQITPVTLKKLMEQKIKIAPIENVDFNKSIRSSVGVGFVDVAEERMTTGETEITLLYEPK